MKKTVSITALLLVYLCLSGYAVDVLGDQTDGRLDKLFIDLKHAESHDEGAAITRKIWEVWYQAPDKEAQSMFDKGVGSMESADYRSSLITLTRVTRMSPTFAEAWNRRATLLFLLGDFDQSIKDIKKTLALEPRHFGAIAGLGQIYLRQDKLVSARRAFQKALDINPHLEGARANIRTIDIMLQEKAI